MSEKTVDVINERPPRPILLQKGGGCLKNLELHCRHLAKAVMKMG